MVRSRRLNLYLAILTVLLITLLGGKPAPGLASVPLGAPVPDQIVLSWIDDPSTTMAISWRTSPDVTGTIVQYWPISESSSRASESDAITVKDEPLPQESVRQVEGSSFLWASSHGEMRIHRVQLTSLSPGTTYAYRVGDGSETRWSSIYTFSTAPTSASTVSLLVVTDSQAPPGQYTAWRYTLKAALSDELLEQFIVHAGDIVDIGGDELHWEQWFDAAADLIACNPLLVALGNHELLQDKGAMAFRSHFYVSDNNPLSYSLTYGNLLHIVVLDSEARGAVDVAEQRRFLEQDLAAHKDLPWTVVVMHRPPHSTVRSWSNEDVLSNYVPLFEEYGVDLVIAGHDHTYARSFPMREREVASDDPLCLAEGIVYVTAGRAGAKGSPRDIYKPSWAAMYCGGVPPMYLNLVFSKDEVRVVSRFVSGVILEDVILKK
ncbi:MAG: fibronectin type III domain-containing protein [Bacteroidota bacterium]